MEISSNFTPLFSLSGGALIGLATTLFLLFLGKIAGISGIVRGLFTAKKHDRPWRAFFIIGMVAGGAIVALTQPELSAKDYTFSPIKLILAAIFVGAGTTLGGGCTSGHGICGLSRFSKRSIVATITFMAFGMLTVYFFGA